MHSLFFDSLCIENATYWREPMTLQCKLLKQHLRYNFWIHVLKLYFGLQLKKNQLNCMDHCPPSSLRTYSLENDSLAYMFIMARSYFLQMERFFFFALWCLSLYDAKYSVTDIAETILKCSVKYVIVYLDLYIYINYKFRRTKIKLYFKRREKKNKQANKIGTDEKYN